MVDEKPPKPKFFNKVEVTVNKVVVETDTVNGVKFVTRVRLETNLNGITYRPKRKVTESKKVDEWNTEEKKTELLTTTELRNEYELLVLLNKKCDESPQKITIPYAEISRFDDKIQKEVFHKYMLDNQFSIIYYEEFHGKNKDNLEKQQEQIDKYKKGEESV